MSESKEKSNNTNKSLFNYEKSNIIKPVRNKSAKINKNFNSEINRHSSFSQINGKNYSYNKFHLFSLKEKSDGEMLKTKNFSNSYEKIRIKNRDSTFPKKRTSHNEKIIEQKNIDEREKTLKITNTKIVNNKSEEKSNEIIIENKSIKYPESLNFFIDISKEMEIKETIKEINAILQQSPIDLDRLIEKLQLLFSTCPVIYEFENTEKVFQPKDFDIFNEKKATKFMLEINLKNLISILNLLFTLIPNKNILTKCLDKLGLYFSYLKRNNKENNNQLDFVLMSTICPVLYNNLSTYGKKLFPTDSEFYQEADQFIQSIDKQNYDEGYFFEEYSTMNLINKIGLEKIKMNPKIMYYLKRELVTKLIEAEVIKCPKSYLFPEDNLKEDGSSFNGYNEVDICFTMKEDAEIQENENFKLFNMHNENKEGKKGDIVFKKDNMYIIEVKLNIDEINRKMVEIKKHFDRFIEALNNIELTQGIKIIKSETKLILMCDKSILDVKREILKNKIKDEVIYTNPQVGMSFILQLNNKVKFLNKTVNENEANITSLNSQMAKVQKEMNEKDEAITSLNTQIYDINKKFETMQRTHYFDIYRERKNVIIYFSFIKPDLIISETKRNSKLHINGIQSLEKLSESMLSFSEAFQDLITFENKKEKSLYQNIEPFIGKIIQKKEDIDKWLKIKEMINAKIKKNSVFSIYYRGLLEFLFGIEYLKDKNGKIDYDILSNEKSEILRNVKRIIKILEVCEENCDLNKIEEKFQAAIIYFYYKIGISEVMLNLFIFEEEVKINKSIHNKTIMKLISCLNSANHEYYVVKKNN